MEPENNVLSDEAIAAHEKEAGTEGDTLRTKIVSELGLTDDDTNKELIDKMVAREGGLRKGFGKLLGDNKTLRDKLKSPTPPAKTAKDDDKSKMSIEDIRNEARAEVRSEFDNEFLNNSDYSDDVKKEIKNIAKMHGITAREASKNSYIQHLVAEETRKKRIDEAADNGTRRGTHRKAVDLSKPLDPKDYDLSTEEGRKAWNDDKEAYRKARKGQ